MKKQFILFFSILILLIPLHLIQAEGATRKEVKKITRKLICQCGCNMVVANCTHDGCPSAIPIRAGIARDLDAGKTSEAIFARLTAEYGKVILASPPAEGFDLLAWILPIFAGLFGLLFIIFVLKHWAQRETQTASAPKVLLKPQSPERKKMLEQIEKELRSDP